MIEEPHPPRKQPAGTSLTESQSVCQGPHSQSHSLSAFLYSSMRNNFSTWDQLCSFFNRVTEHSGLRFPNNALLQTPPNS